MEVRERKAQAPLKEKLSDHYRKRDFTPKKKDVSKLGIAFFWGMTISLFLESVFYLIPHIFSGWNMVIFILLAIFTLFLTTINWMGMFFGSTGFVDKELSKKHFPQATETPRGWKYCPTCQVWFYVEYFVDNFRYHDYASIAVTYPQRFQSDFAPIDAVGTHYNFDWKLSLFSTKLTGTVFIQGSAWLCVSFKRVGLSRDLKDSVTASK